MQRYRALMLLTVAALLALCLGCKAEEEIKPLPTPQPSGPDVIVNNQQNPPEHIIEVSGYGEYIATPDYATITLSVQGSAETAEAASAICGQNKQSVLDVATSLGVRNADIVNAGVTITAQQRESDGAITGYIATDTITIHMDDVSRVNGVLSPIIDAGITESYEVTYSLLDGSAAYNDALADAMQDAQQKADAIAAAGQVTLGSIAAVLEAPGEDQLVGIAFESSSIEVRAQVTVTYLIAGSTSK